MRRRSSVDMVLALLTALSLSCITGCSASADRRKANDDESSQKFISELIKILEERVDNEEGVERNNWSPRNKAINASDTAAGRVSSTACGVPAIAPDVRDPMQFSERIVGGSEARANSWPWQCRLQADLGNGYISLCGASVINSQYLTTAAHCMFNSELNFKRIPDSSYTVTCGDHNRGISEWTEQQSRAALITVHENYNPRDVPYDVAVIKLATPLTLNRYVSPICLPTRDVSAGTKCYVTGWGQTENTGSNRVLRQVELPIVSQSTCRYHYSRLTDSNLCAGVSAGGKDSCQGDSGGPFVCSVNGRWELHGIVSYGRGCADPGIPGVYSRVTSFRSWIGGKTGTGPAYYTTTFSPDLRTTTRSQPTAQCPSGYRLCDNMIYCVKLSAVCNGRDDCGDNSDEQNCYSFSTPTPCPAGYRLCDNRIYCVKLSAVCNGRNDCGDNSDERNCFSSGSVSVMCPARFYFISIAVLFAIMSN